jgi:hypothetical protein
MGEEKKGRETHLLEISGHTKTTNQSDTGRKYEVKWRRNYVMKTNRHCAQRVRV